MTTLSDEQRMLADQMHALMVDHSSPAKLRALIDSGAEWDEDLWRELAAMGVLQIRLPEVHGGIGGSEVDLAIVSEELGRANACVPFFSSIVMAADAIRLAGTEEQQARYLPALGSGTAIATFAYAEGPGGWSAGQIHAQLDGGRLSGAKTPVADGGIADLAVVLCKTDGELALAVVPLEQPGVERTRLESFDQLRAHYRLGFDGVEAELLRGARAMDVLPLLFDRSAVQAAAEAVGGADACLKMARDYTSDRQIFGRPLASYQAIKHKLADIFVANRLARASMLHAASVAATSETDLRSAAAAARLLAIDAFERAARDNLHVHGGIGYTFEANCHFYYRRERTLALSLGDRERWADRLLTNLPDRNAMNARTPAADASPEDATFRAEARAWLAVHAPAHILPDGAPLAEEDELRRGKIWQKVKADAGYAGILLDKSVGGRGGTISDALIFAEEEDRYRLPKGPYIVIGLDMALPVIAKHGTGDQVERFAGPTLRGEITWCQLFSEPSAGSDLAAVRTRAVQDAESGDWIVNGQKVWSSWAHHADWGILVARTDPTLPKHQGLSFFIIDMKAPGVEARPIRQMSGLSDFNETFLTDARIPDRDRVGAPGEGWACTMSVLMGERLNQGSEGKDGAIADLIDFARGTPRDDGTALDSSAVRLRLATAFAEEEAERHFQAEMRACVARGEDPGAQTACVKLVYTNRYQKMSGLALEIREMAGIAHLNDGTTARIMHDYIWAAALRIAAGADEVLRNQIAERVLGMPGEARSDKTIPFNQL